MIKDHVAQRSGPLGRGAAAAELQAPQRAGAPPQQASQQQNSNGQQPFTFAPAFAGHASTAARQQQQTAAGARSRPPPQITPPPQAAAWAAATPAAQGRQPGDGDSQQRADRGALTAPPAAGTKRKILAVDEDEEITIRRVDDEDGAALSTRAQAMQPLQPRAARHAAAPASVLHGTPPRDAPAAKRMAVAQGGSGPLSNRPWWRKPPPAAAPTATPWLAQHPSPAPTPAAAASGRDHGVASPTGSFAFPTPAAAAGDATPPKPRAATPAPAAATAGARQALPALGALPPASPTAGLLGCGRINAGTGLLPLARPPLPGGAAAAAAAGPSASSAAAGRLQAPGRYQPYSTAMSPGGGRPQAPGPTLRCGAPSRETHPRIPRSWLVGAA